MVDIQGDSLSINKNTKLIGKPIISINPAQVCKLIVFSLAKAPTIQSSNTIIKPDQFKEDKYFFIYVGLRGWFSGE